MFSTTFERLSVLAVAVACCFGLLQSCPSKTCQCDHPPATKPCTVEETH